MSDDGVVEGMELKPEAGWCLPFLLSVQFHPERLADRHTEHREIFRAFTQACVAAAQQTLMKSRILVVDDEEAHPPAD